MNQNNGSTPMTTSGPHTRTTGTTALRLIALCATLSLSVAFTLSAQQSTTSSANKELTIEELFLQSVEFQILREKAFSEDYDMKMNALDDLEKKVSDGSYKSNERQIEAVLEYLALEGSGRTVRESGRLVNNFPEVRRRSANLLGRIGTPDAKTALVRVLGIDEEPTVKAEAAYALGVIGNNDNNEAVAALVFAFSREDPTKPDNNLGYALCLAMEKISAKTKGGIKDPSGYQMLVKIAQGNYLRTVKTKALQVLDVMKTSK